MAELFSSLNITLLIFLAGLILLGYFTQSSTAEQTLSQLKLMDPNLVQLTPPEELMTEELMMESLAMLPPSVNLWSRTGSSKIPIDDQGRFGSCTACAMRYAWNLWKMRQNPNSALILPSRLYWYAQSRIRLRFSAPLGDHGSTNSATIWALANKGSVAETLYPYTTANVSQVPGPAIVMAGARNRTNAPVRIMYHVNPANNITAIQRALAEGKSVIVAIMVYSSFMTTAVMKSGNIPSPNASRETLLGGHAVTLTGYEGEFFLFRNSWGNKAGNKGHFRIPFSYIGNPNLTGDVWAL